MTNILLLEDDETIAFGIQKALEKKGYHLLLCSCIEEAKQAFSPAVHLILLDLNLPDGSGYSFCQWANNGMFPLSFLRLRQLPGVDWAECFPTFSSVRSGSPYSRSAQKDCQSPGFQTFPADLRRHPNGL